MIAPERGTRLDDVDYAGVMQVLPHRYPMLLVDRVIDIVAHEGAVGLKNVTMNEPYFPGHFPQDPIMPGVMLIEALGQSAAVCMIKSIAADPAGMSVYFMAIDEARFRRPVRPGDQLRLEVQLERAKLGIWRFGGRAVVDGNLAAEAKLTARLIESGGRR